MGVDVSCARRRGFLAPTVCGDVGMQGKARKQQKPGAAAVAVDETTQHNWAALDEDSRGGRTLDEDAMAREETAVEEAAVAAGEAAVTGDVGATVDVAAAAVEEDDERGRWQATRPRLRRTRPSEFAPQAGSRGVDTATGVVVAAVQRPRRGRRKGDDPVGLQP